MDSASQAPARPSFTAFWKRTKDAASSAAKQVTFVPGNGRSKGRSSRKSISNGSAFNGTSRGYVSGKDVVGDFSDMNSINDTRSISDARSMSEERSINEMGSVTEVGDINDMGGTLTAHTSRTSHTDHTFNTFTTYNTSNTAGTTDTADTIDTADTELNTTADTTVDAADNTDNATIKDVAIDDASTVASVPISSTPLDQQESRESQSSRLSHVSMDSDDSDLEFQAYRRRHLQQQYEQQRYERPAHKPKPKLQPKSQQRQPQQQLPQQQSRQPEQNQGQKQSKQKQHSQHSPQQQQQQQKQPMTAQDKAQIRRAQVRRAQIQHRKRKADYMHQLEIDVNALRDMITATEHESRNLRKENDSIRSHLGIGAVIPDNSQFVGHDTVMDGIDGIVDMDTTMTEGENYQPGQDQYQSYEQNGYGHYENGVPAHYAYSNTGYGTTEPPKDDELVADSRRTTILASGQSNNVVHGFAPDTALDLGLGHVPHSTHEEPATAMTIDSVEVQPPTANLAQRDFSSSEFAASGFANTDFVTPTSVAPEFDGGGFHDSHFPPAAAPPPNFSSPNAPMTQAMTTETATESTPVTMLPTSGFPLTHSPAEHFTIDPSLVQTAAAQEPTQQNAVFETAPVTVAGESTLMESDRPVEAVARADFQPDETSVTEGNIDPLGLGSLATNITPTKGEKDAARMSQFPPRVFPLSHSRTASAPTNHTTSISSVEAMQPLETPASATTPTFPFNDSNVATTFTPPPPPPLSASETVPTIPVTTTDTTPIVTPDVAPAVAPVATPPIGAPQLARHVAPPIAPPISGPISGAPDVYFPGNTPLPATVSHGNIIGSYSHAGEPPAEPAFDFGTHAHHYPRRETRANGSLSAGGSLRPALDISGSEKAPQLMVTSPHTHQISPRMVSGLMEVDAVTASLSPLSLTSSASHGTTMRTADIATPNMSPEYAGSFFNDIDLDDITVTLVMDKCVGTPVYQISSASSSNGSSPPPVQKRPVSPSFGGSHSGDNHAKDLGDSGAERPSSPTNNNPLPNMTLSELEAMAEAKEEAEANEQPMGQHPCGPPSTQSLAAESTASLASAHGSPSLSGSASFTGQPSSGLVQDPSTSTLALVRTSSGPVVPSVVPTEMTLHQTHQAVNFILSLEHVCWDHAGHQYCPPPGGICADSGHALMATSLLLRSAPDEAFDGIEHTIDEVGTLWKPKKQTRKQRYINDHHVPKVSWRAPDVTLETLQGLADSLNPCLDKELTPIQAWFELAAHYPLSLLLRRDVINGLKRGLAGVIKCLYFGAVIERGAFESVVRRVVGPILLAEARAAAAAAAPVAPNGASADTRNNSMSPFAAIEVTTTLTVSTTVIE